MATRVAAGAPEEGTLGTGMDALTVALGNGGAFTVFATVAVTWLKRRTGRMAVKITRPDGSAVEVSSDLVRPQNAEELRETAERLVRALAPPTGRHRTDDLPCRLTEPAGSAGTGRGAESTPTTSRAAADERRGAARELSTVATSGARLGEQPTGPRSRPKSYYVMQAGTHRTVVDASFTGCRA